MLLPTLPVSLLSPKTESDSGIAAIDSEKLFAVVKVTLKQKNK